MGGVLRGLEERVVKRVENVLGPKLDKMLVLMEKQNDLQSVQNKYQSETVNILKNIQRDISILKDLTKQ